MKKPYGPDTIVLAPGEVRQITLVDDDGGDCSGANKWIWWTVIDKSTNVARFISSCNPPNCLQYKHWEHNDTDGSWRCAVTGPAVYAECKGLNCWGASGNDIGVWVSADDQMYMVDIYL
ncbi:hypothetical protein Busp01_47380 [Trinickia caryophylli]|nr:hypothetical protein Busp01_47380 [Trinickia caryophylli]